MSTAEDSVRRILEQLGAWRHLPAYRLEPRADAFFGLYIHGVVERHVARELYRVVIPELPLRKGTLSCDTQKPNESVKADYALFAKNDDVVYLIELKTDQASRRNKQDKNLERAKELGWHKIVDGIVQTMCATTPQHRPKYLHLLDLLEEVGAVSVPSEIYRALPGDILQHLRKVQNLARPETAIEVLYIQPRATDKDKRRDVIDFEEFRSGLPTDDPVARIFGEHLIGWTKPAGEERPQRGPLPRCRAADGQGS